MKDKQRQILEMSQDEMIQEGLDAGKMSVFFGTLAIVCSRLSTDIGRTLSTISAASSALLLAVSANRRFYARYLRLLQEERK